MAALAKPVDRELELYRNLMPVPEKFEDGFGGKTVVGALFLGFLMVPGSIYLTLFMGGGLGPAAQWVTVILFSEIVKRSMKSLRQQEIFVLFYMTGVILGGGAGGVTWNTQLLWNQFFVQSAAADAMGVSSEIPIWFAPAKDALQQAPRTFLFNPAWRIALLYMIGMMVLNRIDQFGLGYALFRITAHVEKLPFPMAPANALGVSALADTRDAGSRARWRSFSFGAVLGLAFGFVYIGVPAVTGAFLTSAVRIIPIPWLDFTPHASTREFLPAVPLNLVLDLGGIILGMVLPFWAVMGMLIGYVATVALNPILYSQGLLKSWVPGSNYVDTTFNNYLDFYLSFSIGLTLAIFVVSLFPLLRPALRAIGFSGRARIAGSAAGVGPGLIRALLDRNRERGDLSVLAALLVYVFSAGTYITICLFMMPGTPEHGYQDRFPWLFFLGFAFLYQPLISYTNAKLVAMVGQTVQIPLVREATFILSGYEGSTIWFAPIPLADYSAGVQSFRVMELTGTKLISLIKTEILALPILIVTVLLFSELIWRMAPIPSDAYPFTKETWELQARQQALIITSTLEGSSPFLEALRFDIAGWGAVIGLSVFTFFGFLRMPTLLTYGIIGGIGQTQGTVFAMVIGALLSRFYFERRFRQEAFKKTIMIIFAGYSAGMGLVGMAAVAINLIVKSTTTAGY
jgi:hypothetical protein